MGLIFDIQKFCIHDGPGIRTTVFLKGCPLRCAWCHNPESKRSERELLYAGRACIGCGACLTVCPKGAHEIRDGVHTLNRSRCTVCGACAEICPSEALSLAGKEIGAEEILRDVLRDKPFYDASGGGLTLSGGEVLLQFDFALALLGGAKTHGLHTCVETCGFAETEKLLKIAKFTDLFLYDWKCTDDALHRAYTGVGNGRILENLLALDEIGASVILRCPIIPGVNDNERHFSSIADLANRLKCILAVEIEPYHSLGTEKSESLGAPCARFPGPTQAEIDAWIKALQEKTSVPVRRA